MRSVRRAGQKTNGKGFGRTYEKGHTEFRAVSIQTQNRQCLCPLLSFLSEKMGSDHGKKIKDDMDAANTIKQ